MKITHGLGLAAILLAGGVPIYAAEEDYFLHPPGCDWGALAGAMTPGSIQAVPGGYFIAGTHYADPDAGEPSSWGVLMRIDETGALVASADFQSEPFRNEIHDGRPLYSPGGALTGFVFTGYQIVDSSVAEKAWVAEGLWTGWTDADLTLTRENVFGRFGAILKGHGVLKEAGAFTVCGADNTLEAHGGLLAGFAADGTKTGEQSLPFAGEIFALAPTDDGGYVLAAENGLVKVNHDGETQWHAGLGEERPEANFYDCYYAVAVASDGGIFAAGRLYNASDETPYIVVAKYAPDGSRVWRQVFGVRAMVNELGIFHLTGGKPGVLTDVLALPGGGCVATGKVLGIYGGSDLLVLKMDADGNEDWALPLGTEANESGSAITLAADGDFVVAGTAKPAGTPRTWIVKVHAGLQAPEALFDVTTPLPVFHGQEVGFDSSASSAPGSHIVSRHWDFGDGTELDDEVAPRHIYYTPDIYPVTLTIKNADGIIKSVTHEVEVIGLVRQWDRYFGETEPIMACGLVTANDGGFVVVGRRSDRLWVLKTDARGHTEWERRIGRDDDEGQQTAYAIVRAPDAGYVVAGADYHYDSEVGRWINQAWLLKLDESGELVWPEIRAFGEAGLHREARCLAATSDDGYIFAGYQTPITMTDPYVPWVVKTDSEGIEQWSAHYDLDSSSIANGIVPAPNGGFACVTDTSSASFHVLRLGDDGALLWDRQFDLHDDGNWIGLRHPPETGFAVVGVADRDIGLRLLDPDGVETSVRLWNGAPGKHWTDIGAHAVPTPDGGFLITGTVQLQKSERPSPQQELALIKTDAEGNTQWAEFTPGTEDVNESGIAAAALDDGGYIVLGSRNTNHSPIWLFKLAFNLAPVPQFTIDPLEARAGETIHLDASASSDPDGEIAAWEWQFDDGSDPATGPTADHVFTRSGVREIRLTVVDDQGAERTLTQTVAIEGIEAGDQQMSLDLSEIIPRPKDVPGLFPRGGAAPGFIWENARGFHMVVNATSSRLRTFRITYQTPLPESFTLYRLPDWVKVPYTIVDDYTLEIRLPIDSGETTLTFVLGQSEPLEPRRLWVAASSNPWLLALHFGTVAGGEYVVESASDLAGPWTQEPFSLDPAQWPRHSTLAGDGENAVIYVNRRSDANVRFFRLRITEPPARP